MHNYIYHPNNLGGPSFCTKKAQIIYLGQIKKGALIPSFICPFSYCSIQIAAFIILYSMNDCEKLPKRKWKRSSLNSLQCMCHQKQNMHTHTHKPKKLFHQLISQFYFKYMPSHTALWLITVSGKYDHSFSGGQVHLNKTHPFPEQQGLTADELEVQVCMMLEYFCL